MIIPDNLLSDSLSGMFTRAIAEQPKADQAREKTKLITKFIDLVNSEKATIFSDRERKKFFTKLGQLLNNISSQEKGKNQQITKEIQDAVKIISSHPDKNTTYPFMLEFIRQLAGTGSTYLNHHWHKVKDSAPVTQAVQWMKNNTSETQLSFALVNEGNLSQREEKFIITMMARLGFQHRLSGEVHFIVNGNNKDTVIEPGLPVLLLPENHFSFYYAKGSYDQGWIAGVLHAIGKFLGVPVPAVEHVKNNPGTDLHLAALLNNEQKLSDTEQALKLAEYFIDEKKRTLIDLRLQDLLNEVKKIPEQKLPQHYREENFQSDYNKLKEQAEAYYDKSSPSEEDRKTYGDIIPARLQEMEQFLEYASKNKNQGVEKKKEWRKKLVDHLIVVERSKAEVEKAVLHLGRLIDRQAPWQFIAAEKRQTLLELASPKVYSPQPDGEPAYYGSVQQPEKWVEEITDMTSVEGTGLLADAQVAFFPQSKILPPPGLGYQNRHQEYLPAFTSERSFS